MKASVLLSTYERREAFIATLQALCNQSIPSKEYEIIVVDNTCLRKEELFMVSHLKKTNGNIKFIREKRANFSQLFNQGVREAKGDYLLILSAHCMPPKKWVENWLNYARARKVDVASGDITVVPSDNAVSAIEAQTKKQLLPKIWQNNEGAFMDFHNALVKRDFFLKMGCFDEDIPFVTTVMEFGARVHSSGKQVAFVQHITVAHVNAHSLSEFCVGAHNDAIDKTMVYIKNGKEYGMRYFPLPTFAKHYRILKMLRFPIYLTLSVYQAVLMLAYEVSCFFPLASLQRLFALKAAAQAHRRGQLAGFNNERRIKRRKA